MKTLVVALVAIVLITAWIVRQQSVSPSRSADRSERDLASARDGASDKDASLGASPGDSSRRVEVEDAATRDDSRESSAAHGIRGRLLADDRAPVSGVEVRLLAIENDLLTSRGVTHPTVQPLQLERSTATTDPDGRFLLPGGMRDALLLLAVDCGGPRGALRMLDVCPDSFGDADVGEIVLPATGTLRGRVVDDSGHPLEGVRVRAGSLPPGFELFLSRVASVLERDGTVLVAELPEWLLPWLERLPIPTTRSRADGSFELHVGHGEISIALDTSGGASVFRSGIDLAAGAQIDLGELRLTAATSVCGRILDARGEPVVAAQVLAGIRSTVPNRPSSPRAGRTDSEGRFAIPETGDGAQILVGARRAPGLAWKFATFERGAQIEMQLDPEAELELTLRDASGAPLDDVELELVGSELSASASDSLQRQPSLGLHASGVARFSALSPGTYQVLARKRGFVAAPKKLEVTAPLTQAEIVLAPLREIAVAVRDAQTGVPVQGAKLTLSVDVRGPAIDRATTDADGTARVFAPIGSAAKLSVEHTEFAPSRGVEVAAIAEHVDVALDVGGELLVRVVERGRPAVGRWTLQIGQSEPPMLAASDAASEVRVEHLPPGSVSYALTSPWVERDPLQMRFDESARPQALLRGTATIASGQRTEIEVELDKEYAGRKPGKARLRGHVTLNGTAPKQASLRLNRQDPHEFSQAELDSSGEFDFGWIEAGRYYAELRFDRAPDVETLSANLWSQSFELAPGETRDIGIELEHSKLEIFVHDRSGAPVADAEVTVLDARNRRSTDFLVTTKSDGRLSLPTFSCGEFRVQAEHPTRGYREQSFRVEPGARVVTVDLELDPGIPCAGTLEIAERFVSHDSSGAAYALLWVRGPGESKSFRDATVRPVDGRWKFSIAGLAPGRYQAGLGVNSRNGDAKPEILELDLGPAGDTQLHLSFLRDREP